MGGGLTGQKWAGVIECFIKQGKREREREKKHGQREAADKISGSRFRFAQSGLEPASDVSSAPGSGETCLHFQLPRCSRANRSDGGGSNVVDWLAAAGVSDLPSALICPDWLQASSGPR